MEPQPQTQGAPGPVGQGHVSPDGGHTVIVWTGSVGRVVCISSDALVQVTELNSKKPGQKDIYWFTSQGRCEAGLPSNLVMSLKSGSSPSFCPAILSISGDATSGPCGGYGTLPQSCPEAEWKGRLSLWLFLLARRKDFPTSPYWPALHIAQEAGRAAGGHSQLSLEDREEHLSPASFSLSLFTLLPWKSMDWVAHKQQRLISPRLHRLEG